MYNGWCTLTQSTNEKFNYLSPHHSFPICCLMSGPMYTLEVWWRMKIWWLLIKASINVNIGWTRLPNPLFCSLLESATKPIDKDEEESYRAAFAGEQKGSAGKLIFPPQRLIGTTMVGSPWAHFRWQKRSCDMKFSHRCWYYWKHSLQSKDKGPDFKLD